MEFDRKSHWEHIYTHKGPKEVSWYQQRPEISLKLIEDAGIDRGDPIIDVGGGDSQLVDALLENGYTDLTVLDISGAAIEKAKSRLGAQADKINWIEADASSFVPNRTYTLWHDRAAFHFLTEADEVAHYCRSAADHIPINGHLIIGTFSDKGPLKCSGLPIQQYTAKTLSKTFGDAFLKKDCFTIDHTTPFGSIQNFLFCHFRKR
jgi:SAM-dependent methyltransferase